MKKTYIIVVHFGSVDLTNRCIKDLYDSNLNFEKIIVVDNSQNYVISKNLKNKKSIEVVFNKKNLGFAAGVNIGIKKSLKEKADYTFLLNNDTKINNNFLKKLTDFLDNEEKAGIVAPSIKFKRKNIYIFDLGGRVNNLFGRTSHLEVKKIIDDLPRAVDYVSGCAMLIRNKAFEKVGLFDEKFFLYYEDVDFCIRARNKGYLTYVLPECKVEHFLSKSIGKNSSMAFYNQTKSALIFGKKHFGDKIVFNRVFIFAQSLLILIKNPDKFSFLSAFKYI